MTDPEHEDVKTWTSSWTYDAFLSTGSAHANFTNSVCSRIDALTPHALAVAALLRATYDLFPVPKETHTDLVIEAQAQRAPFLLIAYKEASLLAQSPIDPPFAPFLNAVRDVNDDAAEVIGDNMVKMLEDSTALPAFHDFLLDLKGLVAPVGHLGPIGSNISPTSPLGILLRRIQADAATLPFHRLPSLFRAVKEHIRDTNSTSNTVWDVPVAAAKKWVDKVTERLEGV
ncbi:hypothetical protein M427DRAFT_318757 [Gonapodya prolifera JEL478]|uniref:Uncharacterized protein n=1 Tax=Gonapodya prolifera (strain JEL478) TaxID=1344416 RepID=A0A139AXD4_GONPJ|nr:hypothetical protein M427DRAFT_318757 [Gonapodya prolifera JEL478]|eukprot:KXS21406.1 hypothetical protein M427DRAFT_318757 [Gonapodya prolifera JEL478]